MENYFYISNKSDISNKTTWIGMDPPRLIVCPGRPNIPYRGFDVSSLLLFLTGVLLFFLSVYVVVRRWRRYVAVRRRHLLAVQAGSRSSHYPGTLRTVVVRGDPRNKYTSHVVGVVPAASLDGGEMIGDTPSAGFEYMPAAKLPPYVEHPLPPSYEDSERRDPPTYHV